MRVGKKIKKKRKSTQTGTQNDGGAHGALLQGMRKAICKIRSCNH